MRFAFYDFPKKVVPTGPIGPTGDTGPQGIAGSGGMTIVFDGDNDGFTSNTVASGAPNVVGVIRFDGLTTFTAVGGLGGTITAPSFNQYGFTMPVNATLDSIALTVGNLAFTPTATQTIHVFAMLAIATGTSQVFTLQPSAIVEVILAGGVAYPTQVNTSVANGLGFPVTAGTRCMIVSGHYTTGANGATSYTFTQSGALYFV